jgi:hypothetical protein
VDVYLEVGLGIEDRPQPFEHDGVVFGDQDAGLQWDRLGFRAEGIESLISGAASRLADR